MTVLDDIKVLRPNVQDTVINLYIRRAETILLKYLNDSSLTDTILEATYPDAIIEMVLASLNRQGDEGIKVSEVSSVQMTYELGIPESVKSMLPLPKVRYVTIRR